MTDRELMQQALDAFLGMGQKAADVMNGDAFHECHIAVSRLRFRLAQPEPEPVAWHEPGAYSNVTVYKKWAEENKWLPLYKENNK